MDSLETLSISDTVATNGAAAGGGGKGAPPSGKGGKKPAAVANCGLTEDQMKKCAGLLGSQLKDCSAQVAVDGMNPENTVHLVSNKEADFVIVLVNGVELVEYQLVFGVPKLSKYDSNKAANKGIQDLQFKRYYLANKWNGMNMQVFKYADNAGTVFVSAKPRAAAFAANDAKGCAVDWVKRVFDARPEIKERLLKARRDNSHVYELCGTDVPHIVKYDFALDLKELFAIGNDGKITPFTNDMGRMVESASVVELDKMHADLMSVKAELLAANKKFREDNGLKEGVFWFNHFKHEGMVLYPLAEDGTLVSGKTIWSVKPQDTERNHWEQFDTELQSKVMIIAHECQEKGLPLTRETMMKEMDLDEYSFSRHAFDIMDIALLPPVAEVKAGAKKSKVLVTCGFPASGKSYFSQRLAESEVGWKRINQDDLGTRKKCEDLFKQYLKSGDNIIIDRCNHDISQRRIWLKMARQAGVMDIHLLWFKIDKQVCKDRIVVRENHPTIPKGNEGIQIIDKFHNMFIEPSAIEGYSTLTYIKSEADSNELIVKYTTPLHPDTTNNQTEEQQSN